MALYATAIGWSEHEDNNDVDNILNIAKKEIKFPQLVKCNKDDLDGQVTIEIQDYFFFAHRFKYAKKV